LQQRVWEVIEGLDLLKTLQQRNKRAVPEELFGFFSCSLKIFMTYVPTATFSLINL
jgi:hypothetical protein